MRMMTCKCWLLPHWRTYNNYPRLGRTIWTAVASLGLQRRSVSWPLSMLQRRQGRHGESTDLNYCKYYRKKMYLPKASHRLFHPEMELRTVQIVCSSWIGNISSICISMWPTDSQVSAVVQNKSADQIVRLRLDVASRTYTRTKILKVNLRNTETSFWH